MRLCQCVGRSQKKALSYSMVELEFMGDVFAVPCGTKKHCSSWVMGILRHWASRKPPWVQV